MGLPDVRDVCRGQCSGGIFLPISGATCSRRRLSRLSCRGERSGGRKERDLAQGGEFDGYADRAPHPVTQSATYRSMVRRVQA